MSESEPRVTLAEIIEQLEKLAAPLVRQNPAMTREAMAQLLGRLRRYRDEHSKNPETLLPRVGRKRYDDWLADLFAQIEMAQPREELLRVFVDRFAEVWEVGKPGQRGPWLFVIEAEHGEDGKVVYTGWRQVGIHADLWSNFCATELKQSDDPLLRRVLIKNQSTELWYMGFIDAHDYGGVFDRLVRAKGRNGRDFWLQAQPLAGERRDDARAVFMLYPNEGDTIEPHPPGNVAHDQRLLPLLTLAYRHLENQIRNLAAYVERSRTQMINLLAPGLLHHEIGHLVSMLTRMTQKLDAELSEINARLKDSDLEVQIERVRDICVSSQQLAGVTDVFNRLERRGKAEAATLATPVTQCHTLLKFRLGDLGVALNYDSVALAEVVLHTDTTLVTHVLLNIVNNALNAIENENTEGRRPTGARRIVRIALAKDIEPAYTGLDISNNGPPIPVEVSPHIFKRGYTTQREGHGQGLYLVHLVAQYLGGNARMLEPAELPAEMTVGFRVTLKRGLKVKEEITREIPS